MTTLLLGGTGQVGWELLTCLSPLGPVIAPNRRTADLANPDSVSSCVRAAAPRLIINAAAYTAVDQAEAEPEVAMAVNGQAPGILAEEAKRLRVPLIHYSTDYVFDGTKDGPYTERDAPNPLNQYGRSKLAGEQAIQAVGGAHIILRTSWVYSARGRNFLRTILWLAHERDTLRIVNDQVGAPTWSRAIALATVFIVVQAHPPRTRLSLQELRGVYHLAAGGEASWFQFAEAILAADPRRSAQRVRSLLPIPSIEYPTPALRPANSRLDCTAMRETFGVALPPWRESLLRVLECGEQFAR